MGCVIPPLIASANSMHSILPRDKFRSPRIELPIMYLLYSSLSCACVHACMHVCSYVHIGSSTVFQYVNHYPTDIIQHYYNCILCTCILHVPSVHECGRQSKYVCFIGMNWSMKM